MNTFIQIDLSHVSVCGIEVPDDAEEIQVDELLTPYLQYWIGDQDTIIDLPSGSWHLVGITPDIEDEEIKAAIESEGVDVSKRWAVLKMDKNVLKNCAAHEDGDCFHDNCAAKNGSCPLPHWSDNYE